MGLLSGLLVGTLATTASLLDQTITNGASLLGSLQAPALPKFLNVDAAQSIPWGDGSTRNTNPYTQSPNTGKVRKYTFNIARQRLAPDGFERDMIVVNGQYPGPTITANWGDIIEVTVNNQIKNPEEGTAIHFHGFLQHKTPWMDGAPGFSQCPIAPGKSFTYRTKAELFGTSWWHAHFSAQYADGAFGPIVVYGPSENDYDIDLGPILLNDYHHADWVTIVKNVTTPKPQPPPPAPVADTNLISGKMQCDCSGTPAGRKCSKNAGLSKFRFRSGKRHRLRLINAGTDSSQQFSIDGHTMTVIENDYVAVKPYDTKIVTLGTGQRTDVIVKAIGKPKDSYWIRSNITCVQNAPRQSEALAMIYYESADTKSIPKSTAWENPAPGCAENPLEKTIPAFPMALPKADKTVTLNITVGPDSQKIWKWNMNGISTRANLSAPVLQLAAAGTPSGSFDRNWSVYDMGSAKSYRFITYNRTPGPHPLHLHGHNMYILDIGTGGQWQGNIVRPENPVRRDTVMVPAQGYVVWQADADNPGAWPFHCHTLWHAATGFGIDILEGADQLRRAPIPGEMKQLCRDWDAFSSRVNHEQIDSGL